jgi:hypothetical protein
VTDTPPQVQGSQSLANVRTISIAEGDDPTRTVTMGDALANLDKSRKVDPARLTAVVKAEDSLKQGTKDGTVRERPGTKLDVVERDRAQERGLKPPVVEHYLDWRSVKCPVSCDFVTQGRFQKAWRLHCENEGLQELSIPSADEFSFWLAAQKPDKPSELALLVEQSDETLEDITARSEAYREQRVPTEPTPPRRGSSFAGIERPGGA